MASGLVLVVACMWLMVGPAQAATPAPAPTSGPYVVGSWSCVDTTTAPPPPPAASSPATTGSDCAVTAWSPVTLPALAPVAPPQVTVSGGGLSPEQEGFFGLCGGLLVLLAAAQLVGSWRA